MKYIMLALSIISINSMENVMVTYVPVEQQAVTPCIPHYDQARNAIMRKDTTDFESLATHLTAQEQITLCHIARSELKNTSSRPMLGFKNGMRFLSGAIITTVGALDFLLTYASGQVKETCQTDCIAITSAIPVDNGGSLCKNICKTISQEKLHVLGIPAGTTAVTAGFGLSGYSIYSLCRHWNDETKLRSMISILQASNHYSDNSRVLDTLSESAFTDSDTEDSDSSEIV